MKSFSKAEASGSSSIRESTIILRVKLSFSSMLFRSTDAVTSAHVTFKLIKMRMNAPLRILEIDLNMLKDLTLIFSTKAELLH